MRPMAIAAGLAAVLLAGGAEAAERVPVVGLPCEGCEAVFDGMPDEIPAAVRIAPADEPGEPLRIEGIVRDAAGDPVSGIVVYAYHTDANGVYPPGAGETAFARRHGRLRAWARTGPDGRYRFDTIRPASYPGTRIPQHVHMHVVEPDCCTYFIDELHFDDDPFLSATERERAKSGRGGSGVVTPERDETGTWHVVRDIALGEHVPGHP